MNHSLTIAPPERYEDAERGRQLASTWAMNQSGLLCGLAYLAYALAFDREFAPVGVAIAGAFVTAWIVLSAGHATLGTAAATLAGLLSAAVLTVHYGVDANAHFIFPIVGLQVLCSYQSRWARYGLFVVVAAATSAVMSGWADGVLPAQFVHVDADYEVAFFTLMSMVACYLVSDDLLKTNREFRLRSRRVVDVLGTRSGELATDLARLGRQSEDLRVANDAFGAEVANGDHVQRQLSVAREQLEQFVYAASHDLKEPLRSISGFVQLIRRRLREHDDAELGEYFDIVLRGTTSMTELLDGLLAYSRAERDATGAEEIDLNRVAALVTHELNAYATQRSGVVTILSPLGQAHCSRRAAQAILRAVVENALKFAAPGHAPRVEICPCPVAGESCVVVRDYGIGIDEAFREKIFTLFQRLNHVDEYPGAGIGLAHARRLARANDIELTAFTPAEGPGVAFRIGFPTPPGAADRDARGDARTQDAPSP